MNLATIVPAVEKSSIDNCGSSFLVKVDSALVLHQAFTEAVVIGSPVR
ncbi:MAG: hypothetical protein LUQ04_11155 [Methanoregula sp.]|nr:hypothetical protein [Methanoregula sp.]